MIKKKRLAGRESDSSDSGRLELNTGCQRICASLMRQSCGSTPGMS